MRAWAYQIATASGDLPEMLGSWAWSQDSRSFNIGLAFACRTSTRLSGGEPRFLLDRVEVRDAPDGLVDDGGALGPVDVDELASEMGDASVPSR